ncbi:MAG: 50S ribosomal protein L11 [Candidatus Aenigmarchaeota archaeon]|nr:50S ribosomal protein L11 [Candidatus Aenigmarchaeota archaeon]
MAKKTVEALIDGGNATPSPPLGPALAQYKVNIGKIIQDINERTKEYEGVKVPVKIIIDDETKEHKIEIGIPPISSLIKKELGLKIIGEEKKEKPEESAEEVKEKPKENKEKAEEVKKRAESVEKKERVIVGNLTIDQCIKIMKMKRDNLLAKNSRKALKEIVGSVVSMPLTIEGKSPKEILKEIDEGKYDNKLD